MLVWVAASPQGFASVCETGGIAKCARLCVADYGAACARQCHCMQRTPTGSATSVFVQLVTAGKAVLATVPDASVPDLCVPHLVCPALCVLL